MKPSDSSYSPRWALTHTKVSSEIFIFSPLEGNKKEDSFKKGSEKKKHQGAKYIQAAFPSLLSFSHTWHEWAILMPVSKWGSANFSIGLIAPPTHKTRIHKYLSSRNIIARRHQRGTCSPCQGLIPIGGNCGKQPQKETDFSFLPSAQVEVVLKP